MARRARRTFTAKFKAEVVLALLSGEKTAAELCREHQLCPNLVSLWKKTYHERIHVVFQGDEEPSAQEDRIAHLEQVIGRQSVELEVLKSVVAASWPEGLKRSVVLELAQHHPARLVCRLLDFPHSSLYRKEPAEDQEKDKRLREDLTRLAGQWPTYGYRRLTEQLWLEGQRINHKRVRRVMCEMGILRKVKKRRKRTTNSDHDFPRWPNLVKELKIERPDQVWVADITYIRLAQDFVYLAVVMDVFTRVIRGWQLGRSLEGDLALEALEQGLKGFTPEIHHSDQGVQYAANAYVDRLKQIGAKVSMAKVGEPRENGYAERLMRTIKEEEVDLSEYQSYRQARERLGSFIDEVYNKKRIHSSLGYLPPMEFEHQWRQARAA